MTDMRRLRRRTIPVSCNSCTEVSSLYTNCRNNCISVPNTIGTFCFMDQSPFRLQVTVLINSARHQSIEMMQIPVARAVINLSAINVFMVKQPIQITTEVIPTRSKCWNCSSRLRVLRCLPMSLDFRTVLVQSAISITVVAVSTVLDTDEQSTCDELIRVILCGFQRARFARLDRVVEYEIGFDLVLSTTTKTFHYTRHDQPSFCCAVSSVSVK